MNDRELFKQALDALEAAYHPNDEVGKVMDAISERLAQPEHVHANDMSEERVHKTEKNEHEPVAWMSQGGDVSRSRRYFEEMGFADLIPLYTAPPQREWVGLTDEEISIIWLEVEIYHFARAIEAKLKEKNS